MTDSDFANMNMNLYEYQRSRSFIDLGPNHLDSIFLNFFNVSSALRWAIHDQWSSGYFITPPAYAEGYVVFSSPEPLGSWVTL